MTQNEYWQVRVEGDPNDLSSLTRELAREPTRLAPDQFEPGHYVLVSDDFKTCTRHEAACEIGLEHVKRLSGLLRCIEGSMTRLTTGATYWVRADGTRDVFARMVGAEFKIRFGHVTAVATDANGNPVPPPPSATQLLARLMNSDAAVAKAMRLIAAPDAESWVGLARIREVIEEDAGGASFIQRTGWASGNELDRFKHSANSVAVAGDAARHGHDRTAPPSKPMTLSEAKEHVERLRREWLNSKGVST